MSEQYVYNINEAAALLHVSRMTIGRLIKSGRLSAIRLGHRTVRIRHEDLVVLMREATR